MKKDYKMYVIEEHKQNNYSIIFTNNMFKHVIKL